jgi:aminoglycoside/choline kinase family phosphotransferase
LSDRAPDIERFLLAHGLAPGRTVLAEDASFRRYWRLAGGFVLMDAPPELEDVRPFLALQEHLSRAGLSVPEVRAADPQAGLVVLEDLGDTLYPSVMHPDNITELYDAAVDALVRLHEIEIPAGVPRWGPEEMQAAAANTFLEWWWPVRFAAPAAASVREAFDGTIAAMLAALQGCESLVHRDFFAGNLFWLPARGGLRRVGIIDFQDAAIGHPAYDLVSLVEDARRTLPQGLAERQVARYLALRPALDPVAFRAAYEACAAQRHLRVAALWVRLARRDGKPQYLHYSRHTWALLEAALRRPGARGLAEFMDRFVPPALRGNPVAEHAV